MSDSVTAHTFTAHLTGIPALLAWAHREAAQLGATATLIERMEIVLEELFANTVHHGYGPVAEKLHPGLCWVQLQAMDGGGLRMTYEDAAPAFNPLHADEHTNDQRHEDADPHARPVGGLGRRLIARLCSASAYVRDAQRHHNVLTLDFLP